MERLKVLITSDGYRDDINGVAQVVATCADVMRKRGIDVKVLTLSDQKISYKKGDDYYFSSYRSKVFPEWKKSHVRRHEFIDELICWNPDIIHIHTEGSSGRIANRIADACGAPVVMTAHTDYEKYIFGGHRILFPIVLIAWAWGYHVYRRASVVIVPSKKVLTFHTSRFIGDRALVLHNGINLKRFQKSVSQTEKRRLLEKYGIRDNEKTLLVVSRLGKEKRIDDILKWMKELLKRDPGISLVIAGDGSYRNELKELSKKLNIDDAVTFTGRIEPEEIYRLYDIGTIFVSASDFEVNSLAYLEAMACGLPIVCRKDPCLEGVLEDGVNGYSYEDGDDFCRYIIRMLENADLRNELGKNAREASLRFSDEYFVDSLLEIYSGLVTEQEGVFAH